MYMTKWGHKAHQIVFVVPWTVIYIKVSFVLIKTKRSRLHFGFVYVVLPMILFPLQIYTAQTLVVSNASKVDGAHSSSESIAAFHMSLINSSALVASDTPSFNCIAVVTYTCH